MRPLVALPAPAFPHCQAVCMEAFQQVRHFEATHCLAVSAMSATYLAGRRELAVSMLSVATALRLPYEAAHDAVLLLDR